MKNNLGGSLFSDFVRMYLPIYSKTKGFNKFGWVLLSAFIIGIPLVE